MAYKLDGLDGLVKGLLSPHNPEEKMGKENQFAAFGSFFVVSHSLRFSLSSCLADQYFVFNIFIRQQSESVFQNKE